MEQTSRSGSGAEQSSPQKRKAEPTKSCFAASLCVNYYAITDFGSWRTMGPQSFIGMSGPTEK